MDSQQSPLAIGTVVFFYKGEKVRIVNFEKPYHEFAEHFVVQSLYSGRVPKAFKHELCIGEPVNEDTDFFNSSQSDEELSCIDEPGTHDKLRPHFILNVFRKQYCLRTKS
jgi:hypothetical protein